MIISVTFAIFFQKYSCELEVKAQEAANKACDIGHIPEGFDGNSWSASETEEILEVMSD